jgi:predicted aspartyl protease
VISSVGPYQRDEKIILEVSIRGRDGKENHMTAMVDCGVTEIFVDRNYAEKIQILIDEKKVPWYILAVDGREVASSPVTHDTMVKLTVNNHHERITLHCITISNSLIIIGLPWLHKHNPTIDWKEGKVIFDSEKYAKECLDTSPHAKMVPEEQAIHCYYWDMARNTIIATTWEEGE